MNIVDDVLTHPVLTTTTGAAVTAVGALNKFAEDLPLVHDLLSDACMGVGLLTCIVGFAVQIRKWRIAGLQEIKLQQEIDHDNARSTNIPILGPDRGKSVRIDD